MNPQDMDIDSFDQWHLPENALHEGHAVIGYANAAVVTLPLAESNLYHPKFPGTISDGWQPFPWTTIPNEIH